MELFFILFFVIFTDWYERFSYFHKDCVTPVFKHFPLEGFCGKSALGLRMLRGRHYNSNWNQSEGR